MGEVQGGLTPFQVRKLHYLAGEADAYAQARGIKNLIVPVGADGHTVLAPGSSYAGHEDLYRAAVESVGPQLKQVLGRENPLAAETESVVATLLLDTPGVFRYRNEQPHFILKNKTRSPVYINCRELVGHPGAMNLVSSLWQQEYESTCEEADVFAGGELTGVYFATWWASMANQNLVAARKPKSYGIPSAIDGRIFEGDRVILVEDLITDGGSKGPFVDGIEKAGGRINDVFVVFDREQGGSEFLTQRGKRLHAQVRRTPFLKKGIELGRITEEALKDIDAYFANAEKWNRDHGYEWKPEGVEG